MRELPLPVLATGWLDGLLAWYSLPLFSREVSSGVFLQKRVCLGQKLQSQHLKDAGDWLKHYIKSYEKADQDIICAVGGRFSGGNPD